MARYADVNFQLVPHSQASVGIEERGLQFGDAVYDVVAMLDGQPLDALHHMRRLAGSLAALSIRPPTSFTVLMARMRRLSILNNLRNGLIYLQIGRGEADRNHSFPSADLPPSVIITTKAMPMLGHAKYRKGVTLLSQLDQRWSRPDIKTVGLLANCLAKEAALGLSYDDALLTTGDGYIREASASNFWAIDAQGVLITPPTDGRILSGITRARLITLFEEAGYQCEIRPLNLAELPTMREAFLTSASGLLVPVVKVNETVIGNGHPGLTTEVLRRHYLAGVETIWPQGDQLAALQNAIPTQWQVPNGLG